MEKLKELRNDVDIIRDELLTLLNNDTALNETTLDQFIDIIKDKPELKDFIKFTIMLNSKNETNVKNFKIKLHEILVKILENKKSLIEITEMHSDVINELRKLIDETKNKKPNSILTSLKNVILNNKTVSTIVSIALLVLFLLIINKIDHEFLLEVFDFLKKFKTL